MRREGSTQFMSRVVDLLVMRRERGREEVVMLAMWRGRRPLESARVTR